MSSKARKEYTPEQKTEAVQLALSSKQSVSQLARTLGMAESRLNRWVHQHQVDRQPSVTGALTTAEREELQRLRRENKQLQMERDFIKKAAAFFAKDLF
jgi:transposase